MARAQGLERTPETVAQMDAEDERGAQVHDGVPGPAQGRLHEGVRVVEEARIEPEVVQVLEQVPEDQRARVEHRERAERGRAPVPAYHVALLASLEVLQRQPVREVGVRQEQ